MNDYYEYRNALDTLSFSPDQKTLLVTKVQAACGQREKRAPFFFSSPRRRVAVVALAALLLVSGLGVTAAVLKLPSQAFVSVFGTAKTEIIDQIGYPLDVSASNGEVKVTAEAILGDQYNACIVYSLTQLDGTPLVLPQGVKPRELLFQSQHIGLNVGSQYGSAWFTVDRETGVLQYVQTLSTSDPIKMGLAQAEFSNLQYLNKETQEYTTLSEGTWKLNFQMEYEDASLSVPAGQTFQRDGIGFTVTEVTLSPVAIQVRYTADASPDFGEEKSGKASEEMTKERNRFLGMPLLVVLKDGTVLDLTDTGGSIRPTDQGADCKVGTVFSQILSLEEVDHITFGEVELVIGG